MTDDKKNNPEILADEELDDVSGALPAVQKVRDAAVRTSISDGTLVEGGSAETISVDAATSNIAL